MRKTFLALLVMVSFAFILTSMKLYSYRKGNPPNSVCVEYNSEERNIFSYWSFDEMNGNVIEERRHDGFHGKVNNITGSSIPFELVKLTDGKYANALMFQGFGWISAGNNSFFSTDKFSISLWAFRSKDGGVPTLIAKSSWPCYDGWWLCTKPETRFIDFAIAWGDGMKHIESGYELPLNEWHHIAVTVDNEKKIIKFYIDGNLYGDPHLDVPDWNVNWNHDLFIGDYDGSGRWPWIGSIDEVYFFNTILSSKDVMEIYENTYIK